MIVSAGLVLWRSACNGVDVLLAHMGGPYFANKDNGGWTIPKGIVEAGEHDLLAVAEREFTEELGAPAPPGLSVDIGSLSNGGKRIHLFAREGDFDPEHMVSNTFELEWPPRSGQIQEFPEVDRAAWIPLSEAEAKLAKNQRAFVSRIQQTVNEQLS